VEFRTRGHARGGRSSAAQRSSSPAAAGALALLAAVALLSGCGARGEPDRLAVDWRPVAPNPLARVEGPGAVVDGRVYVFGGFFKRRGLVAARRVDVYDPALDRWSRRADMPLAVTHIVAAVDGDRVWFAGGYEGDDPGRVVAWVLRYDAREDAWGEGPRLPQPRASGALVRRGRHLHYFGGFAHDRNTTYGDHWALELGGDGGWEPRAPLPEPRGHLAGAVLDDTIYAIGGQFNHDDDRRDVTFVHAWDPASDRWREVAPLPQRRSHHELSTFAYEDRILACGGRSEPGTHRGNTLDFCVAYEPETDRWTEELTLPRALLAPVVVPLDGRLFLTNGSTFLSQRPQADSWIGDLHSSE